MSTSGWIGVDLDGTLALYGGWQGPNHIGPPIHAMVDRVKAWLAEGIEVRIVTARVARTGLFVSDSQMLDNDDFAAQQARVIGDWCQEHIGVRLKVTAQKDFGMICLYDDRCAAVETNTGRILGGGI